MWYGWPWPQWIFLFLFIICTQWLFSTAATVRIWEWWMSFYVEWGFIYFFWHLLDWYWRGRKESWRESETDMQQISPTGVKPGKLRFSGMRSNHLATRLLSNVSLSPQPTVTPSPPPVSQPAPVGNHSPHLPAQQTSTAPPEQSRKAGQNFKCLWQSCKRYASTHQILSLTRN